MHWRNAAIRLVAAIVAHRFGVSHARERDGNLMAGDFAHALHQWLDYFEDPLLLREGHFEIDLGELRLAIGSEILVAETAHDLEVLFEPADHQKLLENLWRLRQRVEMAR